MDWQTQRNQFMRTIGGDPPGAQLEDQLIQAYTEHPDAVERSFEKIALGFKAGKIRSPWGALKAEVAKAVDANRNPHHSKGTAKNAAVQRAEQWVRNAGLHFDRWEEVHDELYGDRGTLKQHPDTEPRMLELWQNLRPSGIQVEDEAVARGERYVQQRDQLKNVHTGETHEQKLERQRALAAIKAGLE